MGEDGGGGGGKRGAQRREGKEGLAQKHSLVCVERPNSGLGHFLREGYRRRGNGNGRGGRREEKEGSSSFCLSLVSLTKECSIPNLQAAVARPKNRAELISYPKRILISPSMWRHLTKQSSNF